MEINIDEEIGGIESQMKDQMKIKKPNGGGSLRRRVLMVGSLVICTVVATLAAATVQLYTCSRQLQILHDLEDAATTLEALIVSHRL